MIFDESVRELMAKVGRETAANPLQEKILHLQWELHNLTGENPPVILASRFVPNRFALGFGDRLERAKLGFWWLYNCTVRRIANLKADFSRINDLCVIPV